MTHADDQHRPTGNGHRKPGGASAPRTSRRRVEPLTRKRAMQRWLVVALSAVFLGGLTIAVVYPIASGSPTAAGSSGNGVAAFEKSATPNPDATEPKPKFHVPAKVDPASGAPSDAMALPKTMRAAARAWDKGTGGTVLATMTTRLGNVTQASGTREYVEMRADCVLLSTDVAKAQALPPIPVAAMQTLYKKALTELAQGASSCRTAISERPDGDEYIQTTENQAVLHTAVSEFAKGARDLYRATAEVAAAGGRH